MRKGRRRETTLPALVIVTEPPTALKGFAVLSELAESTRSIVPRLSPRYIDPGASAVTHCYPYSHAHHHLARSRLLADSNRRALHPSRSVFGFQSDRAL